jgi:hypothetical protein
LGKSSAWEATQFLELPLGIRQKSKTNSLIFAQDNLRSSPRQFLVAAAKEKVNSSRPFKVAA